MGDLPMTAACKSVSINAATCAWTSSGASDGMQRLWWRNEVMAIKAFEIADGLAIRQRRFDRCGSHNDCCFRVFGICLFLVWVADEEGILLAK